MGSFYSTSITGERVYGWIPDLPDIRDKRAQLTKKHVKNKIDLRGEFDSIYDQGSIRSNVALTVCDALVYDQKRQGLSFDPSPLFLYFNQRKLNGTQDYDSGGSIRDTLRMLFKKGVCEESLWPYQPSYVLSKPSSSCYKEAKFRKGVCFRRIDNNLHTLKSCLSSGRPFIFGYSVFESFEDPMIWNPKIDEMPFPNSHKEKLKGGQCGLAVGYTDKRKCFIVKNTWGKDWGMEGYFLMPYRYINSNSCQDFWIIDTGNEDEIVVNESKTRSNESEKKVNDSDVLQIKVSGKENSPKCLIR